MNTPAFLLCSLIFFINHQRYVDPYIIVKAMAGDINLDEKIWIVEMKEINFKLSPGYYQILQPYISVSTIPVVYTKRVGSEFLRCILQNLYYPSKCLNEGEVYIRYPRKLIPINTYPGHLFPKIAEIDKEIRFSEAKRFFRVSGKKVVVGVVDTGIEWKSKYLLHKFKDAREDVKHNFSKAIRIWDQEIAPSFLSSLTYPEGFTYGVECKEPSVLAEQTCPSKDNSGHGTQIAGIISFGGEDTEGIAPDSPMIVVRSTMVEPDVVDAVRYIFSVARKFGLPAVVNISLGGHFGPHDGTSLFEVLLRQELGPGRIIVAAAGNEGNKPIHVRGRFFGERYFSVKVVGDECEVQMWFPQDSIVSIRVAFAGKIGEVAKGQIVYLSSSNKKVSALYFGDGIDLPGNLKYSFPPEKIKDGAVFSVLGFSGEKAEFKVTSSREIIFDAWISSDDKDCYFESVDSEYFLNPVSEGTISVPGTAPDIVAVGSYSIHNGGISKFSSVGIDPSKPNIVAPGEVVYSVCLSTDEALCPGSGTSHSTPQVSGAVALALERNPSLTPYDVIKFLCESARQDEFTGITPNSRWGCGKLDVYKFLSQIPQYPQSSTLVAHNVKYYLGEERFKDELFVTLTVESSLPFRVYGKDFYDFGWSTRKKFLLRKSPETIDIEFLNGHSISQNISPQGFGGCGCFVSGDSSYVASLMYFVLIFLVYYFMRLRVRHCGRN